jgi:ABC-2 type transport system permease protein
VSTFVFIGGRNIARSVRTPMLVAVSLLQPVLWLVLFSQTFRGLAGDAQFRALGYRSYLTFFTPGMIVLSVLFTALQSGMATMSDIDSGMMDKLLTSPVPRLAILAGRVWADVLTMLVQGVIILGVASAMGAAVPADAWLLLALAVAFGVIWAAVSNLIALTSRSSRAGCARWRRPTRPPMSSAPASGCSAARIRCG